MSAAILHLAAQRPEGLAYRRNETVMCGARRNSGEDCMEYPVARARTHRIDDGIRARPWGYGPLYVQGESN